METVENVEAEPMRLSKWKQVEMPISKVITSYLRKEMGFNKVTKVQRETIPLFAKNKDVCVKACTGSGKTLAYLVSVLQIILNHEFSAEKPPKKHELLALILVPARELASQVNAVLVQLLKIFPWLTSYCCIGGNKVSEDMEQYKESGANIMIGTVGRVWDFLDRSILRVKNIKVLIMDEADLFFQQGNQIKLNTIIDHLPKQRRTGLFSATMTAAVQGLVKAGLRNPYYIEIFSYKNEILRQQYEPFAIENLRNEYVLVENFDERILRMKIEQSNGD